MLFYLNHLKNNDKVYLGDPNPDFEMGLQLSLDYKGFYANTTLTGKFGMQIMQSYRSFADRLDQNYTSDIFNRWHGAGTSNRIPRLSSNTHRNTQAISDIFMYDGDYVRINNLTVGYDFSKLLENFVAVSGAKFYVSVNNLHTFTKYKGNKQSSLSSIFPLEVTERAVINSPKCIFSSYSFYFCSIHYFF